MNHDSTIPMPPVRGNRGFADLPWSQQLVVLSWLLLIGLVLLPALIVPGTATTNNLVGNIRWPHTVHEAVQRLDHHTTMVWHGSAHGLERRVHLLITTSIVVVIVGGAAAGRCASTVGKTKRHRVPLCFGNTSPVRVRAILDTK